MDITVIIPTKDEFNNFEKTFNALLKQKLKAKEIIIVDSSIDNSIKNFLHSIKFDMKITYKKVKKAYPGEGRNIAVNLVKTEWLAFLDSKTIPIDTWLYDFSKELIRKKKDIYFGSTKYFYTSKFQQKIRAATFGNKYHITTPGTLIKTKIVLNDNFFLEKVKAAEDLEWRERIIKKKYLIIYPKKHYLEYHSLPNSFFSLISRYFVYSFHTALVDVQKKMKQQYLSFILIFFALIIPRWNHYIPGWDQNHPLYIENLTRIYLLSFLIFFLIYVLLNNFLINNIKYYILSIALKIVLFIVLTYGVYNWNAIVGGWVEKSVFYIPHITKIYISVLLLSSIIIRGILYPMKRNINISYLFPFNWIIVGSYGLALDLVKAPGYILGALTFKFLLTKDITFKKNVVFYPKYAFNYASYRYRFDAYRNILEDNNYKVITSELFDSNFFEKKIYFNKINYYIVAKSYIFRIFDLLFRKKPFIAVVHIELLPFFPNLGEIILKYRKIPFILDIDDAVYHRFCNSNNFLFNSYIQSKFRRMIKYADGLFAGNHYHISYFKKYNSNIIYFPTVINTEIYEKFIDNKKYKNFTVVWIGTPSTSHYLKKIIPTLNQLVKDISIKINIIGANKKDVSKLNCDYYEWNIENELFLLSKCHIGIMPLLDSDWERGKCGFKILQYMALKLPVIASPVGVNKEIIKDNNNGLFAYSSNDWYEKIKHLKDNSKTYTKLSNEGYKTVTKYYNLKSYNKFYFKEIEKIYQLYFNNN